MNEQFTLKTEVIQFTTEPGTYVMSDQVLIHNEQDALDLMGETGTGTIIVHDFNFEPDFFDLSTKKLGDVMQKFANYRVRLAIIGDFSRYPSKILPSFIAESNRQKTYLFVPSLDDVKKIWEAQPY